MKKLIYCFVKTYITKTDAATCVTITYSDNTEQSKYIYFDSIKNEKKIDDEINKLICNMTNISSCDRNGIMRKFDLTVNVHNSYGDYHNEVMEYKKNAEKQ
jgi:hypothetical protein